VGRWLIRGTLLSQHPALKGSVLNNRRLVKVLAIAKEGRSLNNCQESAKELSSLEILRKADATTLVETTWMG